MAALGVGLGVAVMVGIQIVNRSFVVAFRESIEGLAGQPGLEVSAGHGGISEERLDVLRSLEVVDVVSPTVIGRAVPAGTHEAITVYGVDLLAEQRIQSIVVEERDDVAQDVVTLLADPTAIFVTRELAARHGLGVGDTLPLVVASGTQSFRIRGLLRADGIARLYAGDLAIMDVAHAQRWFNRPGRYDQVDVLLRAGADLAGAQQEIGRRLGAGFRVDRPVARTAETERFIGSVELFLVLIGLLGMAGGAFIINGMMTVLVARQRREIATLRCLGARRTEVFLLTITEALLLGLLGAVIGWAAGVGLATYLAGGVGEAIKSLNPLVQIGPAKARAPWWMAAVAIGLASTIAVVSAAFPAWVAYRVPPLAGMRPATIDDGRAGGMWRLGLGGIALIAIGYAALLFTLAVHSRVDPMWLFASDLALVAGYLVLTPVLVVLGARLLGPLLLRFGFTTEAIGCDLILRSPAQFGATACLLEVALVLFVVVAVGLHSSRVSCLDWMIRTMPEDLIAYSPQGGTVFEGASLDASLVERLGAVPGVARAFGTHLTLFNLKDAGVVLRAVDLAPDRQEGTFPYLHYLVRPRPEDVAALLRGDDVVLVSEPLARRLGVARGDELQLPTPDGEVAFRVAGLVVDFTSDLVLVLSRQTFTRRWRDSTVTSVGIMLAPGASEAGVREAVLADAGVQYGLTVLSAASLREEVLHVTEQGFAFSYPLQVFSLVTCAIGLLLTLLAWTEDHRRLLATFRAVGATRAQVGRLVMAQAGIVTLTTAVWALCTGLEVSVRYVRLVFRYVLGYLVSVSVPVTAVAGAIALAFVVALLAAIVPARQAAGLSIAAELRRD